MRAKRIHGPSADQIKSKNVLVFSTVRNELLRLPYFLDYYRSLGVGHFIFIDNASTDGTTELICSQPDATVLWTDESYKESRAGVLWLNEALDEFGSGHWCLTVDSDELFVFHGVEMFDLKLLCDYLDKSGAEAVFTFMLDCYGPHAPSAQNYASGTPFGKACQYFDGDGYYATVGDRFPYYAVFGGMRRRVFFGKGEDGWGPALRKLPLVRWRKGLAYTFSTHSMTPCKLGDITGVLLHYKFLNDFRALAESEVKRGDRFVASHYQRYVHTLTDYRGSFLYPNSIPFVDSAQLLRCGLIRSTKGWVDYIVNAVASIEDKATAERLTEPFRNCHLFGELYFSKPLHESLHFLGLVTQTLKGDNA